LCFSVPLLDGQKTEFLQRRKRAEPDQNKVQEIDVETDIERAEDRESEKRAEYNEFKRNFYFRLPINQ
jgi:hypothetical protein